MATVTVNGVPSQAAAGTRLLEMLRAAGLPAPCGGHGRCGKCRVTAAGALGAVAATEKQLLHADELAAGVRLACCATVQGDCAVQFAAGGAGNIRVAGDMPALTLRPAFGGYGLAVDIGTTTLAARLYDSAGRLLSSGSCWNPQAAFGADVISRIEAALAGKEAALAAAVRQAIDRLLTELAADAGIPPAAVDGLVITGNTAMLHLLTGLSTLPMSRAPFGTSSLFGVGTSAAAIGLRVPRGKAAVYLPPCAAAFLGADLVTALLAAELCEGTSTGLLADIGTNGEIALWHQGRLYCCSTAAGPAFEGAGLSMGMGGRPGAIDHVTVQPDGSLAAHVIGEGTAAGICGSGVVDAVACALATGQLDESGLLEEDPLLLCGAVTLTQKDIRMVQLAKSAIAAGITTLLHTAGLTEQAVEELRIAGGFGSYLKVESAAAIGLVPPALAARVRVVGNAALAGASMLLLDTEKRKDAEKLAAAAQVVELSGDACFAQAYVEGMLF